MIKRKLTFEQHDMISTAVWDYAVRFDNLDERADGLQLLTNYNRDAMNKVLGMLDLDSTYNDMKAVKEAIANKADEILSDPGAWDDYMNETCSC
jgi:hypothetical protein